MKPDKTMQVIIRILLKSKILLLNIQWSWDIQLNQLLFNPDCDDSCAGNCTGKGPKECFECAKGYVKSDEEGCKGTFKLNVLLC